MEDRSQLHYKDHAFYEALDWIRQYYEDSAGFTEDKDKKLNFLKEKIKELYIKANYDSDHADAYYRTCMRRLEEAMDLPLSELSPLLMENISTGSRRVIERLYYPQAGKKEEKK